MTYLDKPHRISLRLTGQLNAPEMKWNGAGLKTLIENERKLGHLIFIRRLSEGGMGRIYEATIPGYSVAWSSKYCRNGRKDDVVKKRFFASADLPLSFCIPNIAAIFETGEAMGVPIYHGIRPGENLGEILMKRQFSIPE